MGGLAGEGDESDVAAGVLGEMAGERRLAGPGVAEQAKHLRAAVLAPALHGYEGVILFGGEFHEADNRKWRIENAARGVANVMLGLVPSISGPMRRRLRSSGQARA